MARAFTRNSRPGSKWRVAFAVASAMLAGACAFQMKSLTRGGVMAPTAEKCGECHVDIYQEWRKSRHAQAWTDPAFVEETLNHQVKNCLPCHAPETIFSPDEKLTLRAKHLDEGVTCIGCHLIQGKHHGPFIAGAVTPHATQADPDLYHSAALCGKCHHGAYAAWQESHDANPKIQTCQQCHMEPVQRKLTQATDLFSRGIVALHEVHDLKRHNFSPLIPPGHPAAAIDIRLEGAAAVVTVHNLLPHNIPEGDFGFRRALLTVQVLDRAGKPLNSVSRDFRKALGTQLAPGQSDELRLPLASPDGIHVEARLDRMRQDGSVALAIAGAALDLESRPGINTP